jgi:hypothetical protein
MRRNATDPQPGRWERSEHLSNTWLSFETKAKASQRRPAATAESHCRPGCPGSMRLRALLHCGQSGRVSGPGRPKSGKPGCGSKTQPIRCRGVEGPRFAKPRRKRGSGNTFFAVCCGQGRYMRLELWSTIEVAPSLQHRSHSMV